MKHLPKYIQDHPKLLNAYRPNVAAVIQREDGQVLWCERAKPPHSWQFPQGGIDGQESLIDALYREIKEELGIANPRTLLSVKKQLPETFRYNFPPKIIQRYLKKGLSSYIGQEQHWFHLSFSGSDKDINLFFEGEHSEFRQFCWGKAEMLEKVAYFKRTAYLKILKGFSIL